MILMEIFSYVIDALLIYVFYDKYFSKERRREFASTAVIWGAFAMMEGINYVFNTVAPYIAVNMSVSLLGLFAMTLLYDAKVAKRIVAVVVFQVAAIVSEIFANVVFLVVSEKYFQDINVLGMFISKLFLLVFLMILMLLQKKQKNIPTHYLITYFAIPIACIFVLCVLYRKSMYIDYISYIATGCIMLLNIVSYYLLDELSDYIIRASKVFQLNNQLETQKEKYEQLASSFIQGNRLIHDVNKHNQMIKKYLEESDYEEAINYIEKIDDSFAELYSSVNTGNLVVDSIIGRFKERLEQIGCAVELSVKINKNRKIMDDYDLVVVLGNVTDNIIEAVTCGEKKRSYVEMKLEMTHTSFVFYAKNSVSSEKKKEKNKWFHGLGLSNVKDTVENYGGTMLVSHTKESYETMIQVPIREE